MSLLGALPQARDAALKTRHHSSNSRGTFSALNLPPYLPSFCTAPLGLKFQCHLRLSRLLDQNAE